MTKPSYYTNQLNQIVTNGEYAPTIVINDGTNKTKHLNLNKESASDLVLWLQENFLK